MSNLGNVGHVVNVGMPAAADSFFDVKKQPTSVTMHVVSAVPGSIAVLIKNGVIIPTTGAPGGRTRADGSGNINFYDMEDSGSTPYYIYTLGTGEDWSATVVGNVVTITQLHAANRVNAYAFA